MSATLDLIASTARRTLHGYQRTVDMRGAPGSVLLQEVRTEVEFCAGDHVLLAFRGYYAEFFRLGEDGTLGAAPERLLDVHAFDLRRDGWGQDQVMALLARWGVPSEARRCRQAPALRLRKRFLVGLGQVVDAVDQLQVHGGAAFGALASGPGGEAWGRLTATPLDGAPLGREAAPCAGFQGRGRGWFTAATGWESEERFAFAFPTLTCTLEARAYEPTSIRFVGASSRHQEEPA